MFTVSPTPSRTSSRPQTLRRNISPNFASHLHPSALVASAILRTGPVPCRPAPSPGSASQVRNPAGRSGKASGSKE
ncbi:hypothetical protein FRC03_003538 [Tulasnella sp. 419]|nr:hypothetical protein FRC03_003538 [Tulasnella sp. 419]